MKGRRITEYDMFVKLPKLVRRADTLGFAPLLEIGNRVIILDLKCKGERRGVAARMGFSGGERGMRVALDSSQSFDILIQTLEKLAEGTPAAGCRSVPENRRRLPKVFTVCKPLWKKLVKQNSRTKIRDIQGGYSDWTF